MRVSIIAAISADGFIAREQNELANWTSKEDKKLFVELTKRAGVMVMGGTTYRTIGRALPGRRNIVYSRSPIDQDGIEATQEAPADLIKRLEKDGFSEVTICGGSAIYDMFLQAGLVTDIYLTVEPLLFGSGVSLARSGLKTHMSVVETRKLTPDVLFVHYAVAA